MSYGLTLCGACRRPRIVDRDVSTSTCPYCGCTERVGKLNFFFTSDDQSEVRAALAHATGADDYMPDRAETVAKKRRIEEADPHSTMEDVEEVAGARAEKMLSAMLDRGFVYETRPGFYKA